MILALDETLIVVSLFAIGMPAMVILITYFLAHLGGWSNLAEKFAETDLPPGKIYRCKTGYLGVARYANCLTLRVCEDGLGLSIMFPFRLFHPTLFIPWEEFHSTRRKRILFWSRTVTYVGMPVLAQISLPGFLCDRLLEEERRRSEGNRRESASF